MNTHAFIGNHDGFVISKFAKGAGEASPELYGVSGGTLATKGGVGLYFDTMMTKPVRWGPYDRRNSSHYNHTKRHEESEYLIAHIGITTRVSGNLHGYLAAGLYDREQVFTMFDPEANNNEGETYVFDGDESGIGFSATMGVIYRGDRHALELGFMTGGEAISAGIGFRF